MDGEGTYERSPPREANCVDSYRVRGQRREGKGSRLESGTVLITSCELIEAFCLQVRYVDRPNLEQQVM